MPELIESQRRFAAALRAGTAATQAAGLFAGDNELVESRLALYRGNSVAASGAALAGAYPVVLQVVGEDFFYGLARAYWDAIPSRSGDLAGYGDLFGEFLCDFAPVRELAYLPDLARLEWLVHECATAADAPRLELAQLAHLPIESLEEVRLSFVPGTAILDSTHPVVEIWQAHQGSLNGSFEINWGRREFACVTRDSIEVRVQALSAGQARLYRALMDSQKLGVALAASLEVEPGTDLSALTSQFLASAPLAGYSLEAY